MTHHPHHPVLTLVRDDDSSADVAVAVEAVDVARPPTGAEAGPGHAGLDRLDETGAASAEYAAVTACGVGLAGVLMKLLTSDFGQNLLKTLLEFFLKMVGIG